MEREEVMPLSAGEERTLRELAAGWPDVSMEGPRDTAFYNTIRRLLATLDAERRDTGLDVIGFAKALFKEIPSCTGCDFDHGWDDHVRAIAAAYGSPSERGSQPDPEPPKCSECGVDGPDFVSRHKRGCTKAWDYPPLAAPLQSDPGVAELRAAARKLADEAARACTEPRRFHENEDHRQQALGHALSAVRSMLGEETP